MYCSCLFFEVMISTKSMLRVDSYRHLIISLIVFQSKSTNIITTASSLPWIIPNVYVLLPSRRVRVCDDCFSVQAELAAIVATVSSTTSSSCHGSEILEPKFEGISSVFKWSCQWCVNGCVINPKIVQCNFFFIFT